MVRRPGADTFYVVCGLGCGALALVGWELEEVRSKGMVLITASKNFGDDPCSKVKRSSMVAAARSLLILMFFLLFLLVE